MSVYRRYFKVTSGPLMEEYFAHKEVEKAAVASYREILKEVGAGLEFYHRGGKLVAMQFEKPDPSLYKRVKRCKDGWYPRQNTKFGKALNQRLQGVQTSALEDCLKTVGLGGGFPLMLKDGHSHYATIIALPWENPVLLINVPWYDEDPEKISKAAEEDGMDLNMSHLQWSPSEDMEEIKEWQYLKLVDEWNSQVEAKKTKEKKACAQNYSVSTWRPQA